MYRYIAIHKHHYGKTVIQFSSPCDMLSGMEYNQANVEKLASKLGLDFDWDREESIDIVSLDDLGIVLSSFDVYEIHNAK